MYIHTCMHACIHTYIHTGRCLCDAGNLNAHSRKPEILKP